MKVTTCSVLTMLLSFSIGLAYGQSGGIKGHITNPEDKVGFAGVSVSVLKGDTLVARTVTDQQGDFEIIPIKPGLYSVLLHIGGYRDKTLLDIQITPGPPRIYNIMHPAPCYPSSKKCPKGHVDKIISIMYGEPTKAMRRQANNGKIKLGGMPTDCDPTWHCVRHNIDF